MTRVAFAAVLLASACAFAQDEPYNTLDFRMHHSAADPFRYYIDARGQHPNTVQLAQVQTAVDNAYNTWEQVACAYPAFQSLGLSSTNAQIVDARDPYDSFNVTAVWVKDPNDPYYLHVLGGGAAAAATVPLTYGGNLYQCDIYLNAVDFTWATITPTPQGAVDVQTFILHEIGHCLGLGHSENWDDVMWGGSYFGGQRRALTTRDQNKICELYPQTGAVGSPCNMDGTCTSTAVSGPLTCVTPSLPDGGTTPRMCTKGCDPAGAFECDAPFVCKPFSPSVGGKAGACLPTYGDYITQIGAPCGADQQCGSANGQCIPEGQLPSGFPAWQSGYCTQQCGTGHPACPAGASCIELSANVERCLKSCRIGTGDCRMGYTCSNVAQDTNLCVPSCHSDTDCGQGYICRLCDGTCLPRQSSTGQVGDLCTTADQCGPGQVCLYFGDGGTSGVCSQSCATACTACPTGSTCHPLQNGDLYCLRDCTLGSCASGLQCGLLPTGRGCIPGCSTNDECPVGSTCFGGQCTTPGAFDGGTCQLCGNADAGNPGSTGGVPDAGNTPSGGGCGCGSVPGIALIVPLFLGLLLLARRRRARTT